MKKQLMLLLIAIAINTLAHGQTNWFQNYLQPDGTYRFDDEKGKVMKADLFTTYNDQFGFSAGNAMVLQAEAAMDTNGGVSTRYRQYYQGYPVEATGMNVISKYGVVLFINGFYMPQFSVNTTDPIAEGDALTIALGNVYADRYAWQDTAMENGIKISMDTQTGDSLYDSTKTYYPKGELVIAHPWGDTAYQDTTRYALCWKFLVTPMHWDTVVIDTNTVDTFAKYDTVAKYVLSPNQIIYINAINGLVYTIDPNMCGGGYLSCEIEPTWYHGNQEVQIWKSTFGPTRYANDQRGIDVESVDNIGNTWGSHESIWHKWTEATAYWCMQRSWDYYSLIHGFGAGPNSVNGHTPKNEQKIYVNEAISLNDRVYWQQGPGTRDDYHVQKDQGSEDVRSAANLDVIAHEYTHAMIRANPGLAAYGDAGDIAEGFCDYFGIYAATWAYPSRYISDWNDGFGHHTGDFSRYIYNPPSDWPNAGFDLYGGTNVISQNYFDPAVTKYQRSGLLRKVLGLSEAGGTHNGISVNAIPAPMHDAFVTMIWWSWSSMDYMAMRNQFLYEYEYYYGKCSPRWISMVRAWASVGIGSIPFCAKTIIKGAEVVTDLQLAHHNVPPIFINPTDANGSLGRVAHNWTLPADWSYHFGDDGKDSSVVYIDSVQDLSSRTVYCIVTYEDAKSDTLSTFIHFVDSSVLDTGVTMGGRHSMPINVISETSDNIKIYPNPVKSQLNVILPDQPKVHVPFKVFDVTGREIYSSTLYTKANVVSLSNLSPGIYIVKIKSDGKEFVKRITVQ